MFYMSWLNWEWIVAGIGLIVIIIVYRMYYRYKYINFSKLSDEFGITKYVLKKLLKIVKNKQIPAYDWNDKLRKITIYYKRLLTKVAEFNSDIPEMIKLIEQSKQALDICEFNKVEDLFNQINELHIKIAKQVQDVDSNLLLASESLAMNGKLQFIQLEYKEAGKYYERAAELLIFSHYYNYYYLVHYLNWAGYAFKNAGLYQQAKSLFEQTLTIRSKAFMQNFYNAIASSRQAKYFIKDFKAKGNKGTSNCQARIQLESALTSCERILTKEYNYFITNLDHLIELHKIQNNYDQVKLLYKKLFTIFEKVFGTKYTNITTIINDLELLDIFPK